MEDPISSSSSITSSPITDPPSHPHQIDRNNNLLCAESFSQIIKKEEAVVTVSNACSTNSTVFALNFERKRLRSLSIDEQEEKKESGNQENNNGEEATDELCDESFCEIVKKEVVTISDSCSTNCTVFALGERKSVRSPSTDEGNVIDEGQKEHDRQNGNQESELDEQKENEGRKEEFGNHGNSNGEEEEDETEETEEEETGESENHEESEQNDQSGNQESEQNDQSGNQDDDDDDDDDGEEENSGTDENQEENEDDDYEEEDDHHLDLAILESIYEYKCENTSGDFRNPHSENLYLHIKDAIPSLKIPQLKVAEKIVSFQEKFNRLRETETDNFDQPIDEEIFNWCKQIWGDSERKRRRSPSTDDSGNQTVL